MLATGGKSGLKPQGTISSAKQLRVDQKKYVFSLVAQHKGRQQDKKKSTIYPCHKFSDTKYTSIVTLYFGFVLLVNVVL